MLNSFDHGPNRRGADVVAGLADGGERDVQNAGVLGVVNASDFDFAWDLDAEFIEAHHDLAGGAVIGTNEAIGPVLGEQAGDRFAGLCIANFHDLHVACLPHGFAIAGNALVDGGG